MTKGKILIIDDDPLFLEMLCELLFRKGYDVRKSASIDESLAELVRDDLDIVFIDASLRNVPGTAGIRKVRETQQHADIVVVMSLDDSSKATEFLKEGASDFVLKPYKSEEIDLVIHRLFKRKIIEKDRELLLYENIEFIELLSLYRRIIRIVTEWELDKLKDMLLDEIMNSTFGQGALFYTADSQDDERFACDVYKGIVDKELISAKVPRSQLDNPDMGSYFNPRELNIPLRHEDRNYAFIKVVEPLLQDGFTDKEFNKAYHICEFMSYALENAKRLETLQKFTVKDERTHAYYWDIFRDFVKKEIYKALRYDRKLSIMGVRAENLAALRTEHRDDLVQTALGELTDTVNGVIRDSDWLVEKKPGEYLVFLTETDYFGAIMTIRRMRQALVGKCIIKGARTVDELQVNMSAVGLPLHGVTLEELLQNLDERMDILRNSICHQLDLGRKTFDQVCEDVIAFREKGVDATNLFYAWSGRTDGFFEQTLALILADVRLSAHRRGILYAGILDGASTPFIADRDGLAEVVTKTYFFLGRNKESFDVPGIVGVGVPSDEEKGFRFILYLNEQYSYVCIEVGDNSFESCDSLLVESLISKLQMEHYLQWQL